MNMGRNYSNTIPATYEIDVQELTNHTYDNIPEKFKDKKLPRRAYKFADMSAKNPSKVKVQNFTYWTPDIGN